MTQGALLAKQAWVTEGLDTTQNISTADDEPVNSSDTEVNESDDESDEEASNSNEYKSVSARGIFL